MTAAYRPVALTVRAQRTDGQAVPPVVYCDIYFGGTYYKTVAKTQYAQLNSTDSDWFFDIEDAAQEFLQSSIADNGYPGIYWYQHAMATTFCRFRSSGYDPNGFIVPEGTVPVQGTGGTSPVPGTGTQSNSFFVLNCQLQHTDNQDLATHLRYQFANTFTPGAATHALPLTHRPYRYNVGLNDSDSYPFVSTQAQVLKLLRIKYKIKGTGVYNERETLVGDTLQAGVYSLPNGPKNLRPLFDSLDWSIIEEYFLELWNADSTLILTTCVNKVIDADNDICRVHFLNYLGTIDAVTFPKAQITHEDKNDEYVRPLPYPLTKTATSVQRFNVRSNDTYEVRSRQYPEDALSWLQELKDSPMAFVEWTGTEGQPDSYLPIVVNSSKIDKQKNQASGDYVYTFVMQFKLGNQNYSIRT
ncbi:hypothetical protein [Deminuibacter soli]|uniref:hypothetical protein n=1 Tax=Deminuibacter soli TaxID=2291815 RepID=UPI0011C16A50|nr:hypothetical protein [Deminuibacter soli]